MDSPPAPLPPAVSSVVDSTFTLLPASTPLAAHNDAFLARHAASAAHLQAGYRVRQILEPGSRPRNERDLLATLDAADVPLGVAEKGLRLLEEWRSAAEVKAEYLEKARARWPEATVFQRKG